MDSDVSLDLIEALDGLNVDSKDPILEAEKSLPEEITDESVFLQLSDGQYLGDSDEMLHGTCLFNPPKETFVLGPKEIKMLTLTEKALNEDKIAWRTWMHEKTIQEACRPLILKKHHFPDHLRQQIVIDKPVDAQDIKHMPCHWKKGPKPTPMGKSSISS
jgi:hypothetical protein